MKTILIFLIVLSYSTQISAQDKVSYSDNDYFLVKNFLQWEKNNPSLFSAKYNYQWSHSFILNKWQKRWPLISNKKNISTQLLPGNTSMPQFSLAGFNASDYRSIPVIEEGPGLLSIIAGAAFGIFVESKYHINNGVIDFNRRSSGYDYYNSKTQYQDLQKNY